MNSFQDNLIQEFRKGWKLIVILMIVAGAALVGEKMFLGETITQSGLYYVEKVVNIKCMGPHTDFLGGTGDSLGAFSMLTSFMDESKESYDYTKFHAGWDTLKFEPKAIWLKKHLTVGGTQGLYVFAFTVLAEDPKDDEYLKQYGRKYLEAYIDYTRQKLEAAGLPVEYRVVSEMESVPEKTVISGKRMALKYAVIGVVLGALLGGLILTVRAVRKQNHV